MTGTSSGRQSYLHRRPLRDGLLLLGPIEAEVSRLQPARSGVNVVHAQAGSQLVK
jgi:hypothetical protein